MELATHCLHHSFALSLNVVKLIHQFILAVLDLLLRHVPVQMHRFMFRRHTNRS
jgi:hypothetical protein